MSIFKHQSIIKNMQRSAVTKYGKKVHSLQIFINSNMKTSSSTCFMENKNKNERKKWNGIYTNTT